MKRIFTILIVFASITSFGQQITSDEWNEQAKTNIRLLPKYGYISKTEGEKKADKEFMEITHKQFSSNRKASEHLIELGFKYLYSDAKTAMYRFNQAYLLDSTNIDIYWGYGGVYMTLGDFPNAQKQYLEGLSIEPTSTHLLTDYGTYFMAQYYTLQLIDEKNAFPNLDSAISYLSKSYRLDSKDQNTLFKLSICYYQKKDCKNSRKYYDECKSLGGQPITDDYTKALNEQCKRS